MKRPRLNILRTFEAAGRQLSFSLAATDLNISQAAVSQQIRQLESYLDTLLFIRHHRRLTLTSTGQVYLDAVHESLDRLDSITDQLFPGRQHQAVTLHCTSSIATLWLAPHLRTFQNHYPNIELRIKTLDQSFENRDLSRSELEIFIPADISDIDPNTEKLLTSTILPVCSASLFSGASRPDKPVDVLKHELIHVLGYDDDWHRWFRSFQLKDVDIPRGLSVDSSLIAIEAVQRGDGIMLGRRPFIDSHLKSGELVEVFTKPFHLHTDYYLRQPAKKTGHDANKKVAKWLTGLAASSHRKE